MRGIRYNDLVELESAVAASVRVLENGCLATGIDDLLWRCKSIIDTRNTTLKECRTVTTLKYLLRILYNRLHYILNDSRRNCVCKTICPQPYACL